MTEAQENERPRRSRRRRAARWLGWSLVAPAAVLAITLAVVLDRPMTAPDWLRARVVSGISAALPGLGIDVSDLSILVDRSGAAQVGLRNLDVTGEGGAVLASVGAASIRLSALDLLRGGSGLRDVTLSGGQVTLWRDLGGRLRLAFGQALPRPDATRGIIDVIRDIDGALARPALAGLHSLTADNLTIRYEDARARRGWTIDGGRLSITRRDGLLDVGGDFVVLLGGPDATTIALSADSRIGDTALRFGFTIDGVPSTELATQSGALAWLGALKAPISGALRGETDSDGRLGPLNATLQIGAGVIQPNEATRPVPFSGARVYLTFDPSEDRIRFDELSFESAWGQVAANGTARLGGRSRPEDLPTRLEGQVEITRLVANPMALFERELSVRRAEADFQMDFAPFRFRLGRMRIDDETLPLFLTGTAEATGAGWKVSADARLARASTERIAALWPASVKPKTRDWFVQNVTGGSASRLRTALRWTEGTAPIAYADFRIENAQVRYARRLPPLSEATGQFTLFENRLVIAADSGVIKLDGAPPLDVAGSAFVIPDVRIKQPPAELHLRAAGPLASVFRYINTAPLSVLDKAGLPVDLASGDATAEGTIALRLRKGLKPPDIAIDLAGRATGVRTERLVKGRVLESDALAFAVTNAEVRVSGRGRLEGVPFDATWTQPLGKPGVPGRLTARVSLSDAAARRFGVELPDGLLRGEGRGTLELVLAKGAAPRFALSSDLEGIGLSLPAVGWSKAPGARGSLEIAGQLGKPVRIDRFALDAGGLRATADILLDDAGRFRELRSRDLSLNGWLQAPVTLTSRGRGQAPAVTIGGGTLDLRRAPFGSAQARGGGRGQSIPLSLTLDRLQLSDTIWLGGFSGAFSTARGFEGRFTGRVNGKASVAGEVVSTSRGPSIRIASDNAGRLFAAAGLLQNAKGGKLTLAITPAGTPGHYDGQLDASDIRVTEAPMIASLLDGISVVGLIDQLEGPGIWFSSVDATFRLTPQQVILRNAVASGPSMSVTLDGYYTLSDKSLDLQGVLSPIYVLNAVGQLFSRRGQGLIGFNFNVSGTAAEPRVSVNPLSALTPGLFREIFRRPAPEVSD